MAGRFDAVGGELVSPHLFAAGQELRVLDDSVFSKPNRLKQKT
jgi:hypothetical protein